MERVGSAGRLGSTTVEQVADTARTVVGPDEPPDGRSAAGMAADHWAELARRLRRAGVVTDASDLRRLRHDVVLSDRVARWLGRTGDDVGGA